MVYGGATAGNPKLLRHATILELCLYCHSNNQANLSSPTPPDVWSSPVAAGKGGTGDGNSNPSAGLLCAGGSAIASPPCGTTNTNHTVDSSPVASITPPGGTAIFTSGNGGFTCVNCHNPHGTTNYRNLRNASYGTGTALVNFTGVDVSYATVADATKYVNIGVTTWPGKYQTSNVKFRKANTSNTDGIQGFCKACHTLFHGAGDASTTTGMGGSNTGAGDNNTGTPWIRHPTMDVSMSEGNTNLHVDGSYWTATSWQPRNIDTDNSLATTTDTYPFCLSCHRAHGSTRHSNLIFGDPVSATTKGDLDSTEAGWPNRRMRDTCNQCHNQ